MENILALVIGVLYAAGIYMMLRRSLVKLIIGLVLLSNAANLLIFLSGGLVPARPPLVAPGSQALAPPYADPLPQALILTAIVISFGVLAFALALFYRAAEEAGADDLDRLTSTDT